MNRQIISKRFEWKKLRVPGGRTYMYWSQRVESIARGKSAETVWLFHESNGPQPPSAPKGKFL